MDEIEVNSVLRDPRHLQPMDVVVLGKGRATAQLPDMGAFLGVGCDAGN